MLLLVPRYKQEYLRFLTYAMGSCDETIDHLETLAETGSLNDDKLFYELHRRLDYLGMKLASANQSSARICPQSPLPPQGRERTRN